MRAHLALADIARQLAGCSALEIGGPSELFLSRTGLPIYRELGSLDLLDYAEDTLWSAGQIPELRSPARLIVGEAAELGGIADGSYDVVLASHVIEHIANPLGALAQWRRVLRPRGYVLLVVPHRDGTFDHRRAATTAEHLRSDAERATPEDDLSHLEEILALHDLGRDPDAPQDREAFEKRCRENFVHRGLHHHVFTTRTVAELCALAGLEVVALRALSPFHIFCLARIGERPGAVGEQRVVARALRRSPFPSDRANRSAAAGTRSLR